MNESLKTIKVSAAAIFRKGQEGVQVFATQRGYGPWKDWWEFPGGKIEEGEGPEAALVREIQEELESQVLVNKSLGLVEWDYPEFHLSMELFSCSLKSGGLCLLEHEDSKWLGLDELDSVKWLPADKEILGRVKKEMLSL